MHKDKKIPDKTQIRTFLEELRSQQLSEAESVEDRKKMISKMTQSFYNIGYIGYYAGTQS